MRLIALIGLMMAAAGCGGSATGVVEFYGLTVGHKGEVSADEKSPDEDRYVTVRCSACSTPVAPGAGTCPYRDCLEELAWESSYDCRWCKGTGKCQACELFEQVDGKCYNCEGRGYLAYLGKTKDCPNCQGKKGCPTCGGSEKCDICNGDAKVGMDVIGERVRGKESSEESFE